MRRVTDSAVTILFFAIPSIMLLLGFYFFPFPLSEMQKTIILIPLFGGLFLLFFGYLLDPSKKAGLLRTSGWILFSFYWATQPSTLYWYENQDLINAVICILGVYVLFYFAYKEWFTPSKCLNWIAGASAIAGLIYFIMDKMSVLRDALISIVAQQSAAILSLFSDKVLVDGNMIWFGHNYEMLQQNASYGATAQIIFACTAIQSMLLFVGMISALKVKPLPKIYALLATVPTIYVLNLIRNAGVIFLVGAGITDMNIAHNYIGKIGSLVALIVLVFVVFKILPELQKQILCIFDLYKSKGPLERFLGNLGKRI